MKRQIKYRYYFGGVTVSLFIDDGKWINIIDVAFLTEIQGFSRWESGANLLTAEEVADIYNNATNIVKEWIKWAFDPNHHSTEAMVEKHLAEHYSKFKCDLPEYHATNLEEGFFIIKSPKKTPLLKRQRKINNNK